MKETLFGNDMDQWLVALGFAVGGYVIARALYVVLGIILSRIVSRTTTRLDDILVGRLKDPIVLAVTLFGFYLGFQQLDFVPRVELWADRIFRISISLTFAWMLVRLLDALVQEYLLPKAKGNGSLVIESQLVPVIRSSIKILVWGLGIVLAMNNAGYNVGALLAGMGIGGLAMAMAAKDTIANVFGGITVFSDKPFKTGDRIRIDGHDGTVKEIGIRSTRIQTLDGPMVIIPNFKFTDTILENITEEPSRKVKHDLGLVYGTSPEKMKEAIAVLGNLVSDHQDMLLPDHVAAFTALKDHSMNIVFTYYIRPNKDVFAVQTKVNLEMIRRFSAAGLEFAHPASVPIQSVYKGS